jgi:dipeptidyl aminopeptidase/acylaminoacyl peptidase
LLIVLSTPLASACGLAPLPIPSTPAAANPTLPEATAPQSPQIFSSTWTPAITPPTPGEETAQIGNAGPVQGTEPVGQSPTPAITPTPNPYAHLTIEYLASRNYGGGELQIADTLQQTSRYTRYLIRFPSDGLNIYGFMNTPQGQGPFPVIIALHGYIDPAVYETLDYTTDNADAIARAGYLVIHPNLRGYQPSDSGPNLFRVGMAEDVLNLIAIIKEQAGKPGPLEFADPQAIGLWGHSMGGGISTRVITASADVAAAVLYGAMSGDEKRNFEAIYGWSEGQRGLEELNVPPVVLERISPANFLDRVQAAVSIHHGGSDELVPLEWSLEMCERLEDLGKTVECFTYPGQPHTIYGESEDLFNQRVIEFYDRIFKD